MKTQIRHVVWDWNGTLLDDVTASVEAINAVRRVRNMPAITELQHRNLFGFPVRDYYVRLGFDLARENWDMLAAEFHNLYEESSRTTPLRQGIREVLHEMQVRGIMMSVLSASNRAILDRMVAERGIRHYFRELHGLSDLFASSKLDLGRKLMEQSHIPAAQTLLVGDTVHDYEVAAELGWSCILMAGGHQAEHRLLACGCSIIQESPALLSLLV
ncbi:MAG: HAD family hydrolase [Verrucomicrobia bacterium]|nr:HAD family hydrolase [Verrucomicrobiota bacterium]